MKVPPPQPVWFPFNINASVKVRLTPRGRQLLIEEDARWARLIRSRGGQWPVYQLPVEDKDGWSVWQMWDLMAKLGKHCGMGSKTPFETNVLVEIDPPFCP